MFEYFYRLYNLFRKSSQARPLNAQKSMVSDGTLERHIIVNCLVAGLLPNQLHHCLVDLGCGIDCVSTRSTPWDRRRLTRSPQGNCPYNSVQ